MKKLTAFLLALTILLSVTACSPSSDTTTTTDGSTGSSGTVALDKNGVVIFEGDYSWNTTVTALSTNWNPHAYQTEYDAAPLEYIASTMYSFIFNDALHPIEGLEPYEGYVIVPEMAAAMPEDVTASIKVSNPEFMIPEGAESGFAYKIKLNENATWDDGTKINAQSYVDSFQRLLDPKLQNDRASDWYGQTLSIAGAEQYNNQQVIKYVDDASIVVSELLIDEEGNYVTPKGEKVFIAIDRNLGWCQGNTLKQYVDAYGEQYFDLTHWRTLRKMVDSKGLVPANDETIEMLTVLVLGNEKWGDKETDIPNYLVYETCPYPDEYDWSNVGVLATGEYELTLVLNKTLTGLDMLTEISKVSTMLVKTDLYDACLKSSKNKEGELVWTSNYNATLETSASFGPYKLSEFYEYVAMHFVRNENWYGYTDGKHIYQDPNDGKIYPMYQTTEIDMEVISEPTTRRMMFMKGELMDYVLQPKDSASLRLSDYCYATPAETLYFLVLNGNMEAITERENAENFDKGSKDLQILTNMAFRKALRFGLNRDELASVIDPGYTTALGLIGDAFISEVNSGVKYRDSDQAKKVLCDFYGIEASKFANLDEAVASIQTCDPKLAKTYFAQAFQEGIQAGYINDADEDGKCDQTIEIEYAMSADSVKLTAMLEHLNKKLTEITAGTPFAGKIKIVKSMPYGSEWEDMLRNGQSDIVVESRSGSLLDPYGLIDLYTNASKQLDAAWFDAGKETMTLCVPVGGSEKAVTMTLKQWSDALSGTTVTVDGVEYNFGADQTELEVRLDILAACETEILATHNYLPLLQNGAMTLVSQQVYYVTDTYNAFLGRGGIAYTKYHFNDVEWKQYVEEQGGRLSY